VALLYGVGYLDVGRWDKDMDKSHIGIETGLCISLNNSGKAAHLGREARAGNLPNAFELAFRRYWKTGLDDVHTELIELFGNGKFLLRGE
jgi:hypothetical protein